MTKKEMLDRINVLEYALDAMLDVYGDEECSHDHHGSCQAHSCRAIYDGKKFTPECEVALAREAMEGALIYQND